MYAASLCLPFFPLLPRLDTDKSHSWGSSRFLETLNIAFNMITYNKMKIKMKLGMKNMSCDNTMFVYLSQNFIYSSYKIHQYFESFARQNLFQYILSMKDRKVLMLTAKYYFDKLRTFVMLHLG